MRHSLRRGRSAALGTALIASTVFSVGVAATTALPARAQNASVVASTNPVTLDVREAKLEDAVQLLTRQTGVNNVVFVNVPGKAFGVVTVKMDEQPFDKVLRAMAASAMATVTNEDGVYYLRPRGTEEDAPKPRNPVVTTPTVVAKKRKVQTVSIPLQFLIPSQFKQLAEMGELFDQDPLLPRLEAAVRRANRPENESRQQLNIITGNGPNGQVTTVDGKPVLEGQQLTEGASANRDGEDGLGAGQRGGAGGRAGGGFGQGGGFQGGPGGGGGAPGGQNGGQNGQNGGFLPEGVDRIISYDANNTLLVQGDPEGIEELRALIRFLDVAPKQVIIKAEFVQVSLTDADRFGIDWQFKFANNIDTNIPSQSGPTPTFALAYASGNAVANLRATLTRSTTDLIQSPIISTTNNTPGSIAFQSQQPIFNTVQTITNGGTVVSQTQVTFAQATNGLTVVPHINGDNSISMGLNPRLQSLNQVNGPNGNVAQGVTTQQLTTFRRVQSGETIVLGGFITRQTDRAVQKVPFLSDLPIIGNLFTQKTRTQNGSETLVFITPTIIEDRSAGSVGGNGSVTP